MPSAKMSPVNLDEELFTLGKARRELIPLAPSGRPISPSTSWRWINRGLPTPSGKRVKLRVVMCGGTPMLTKKSIEEFFFELTEARERADSESSERTDSTDRRLAAQGLV